MIVDNVAGHGGEALGRRPPREPALRRDQAPRRPCSRVPPLALAKEVDERIADPLNPITVKTAVGEDQVAYLYEHAAEFPGVQIQQTYLRHYPYQSLAAQVLGYVGEVSQGELDAASRASTSPGDKVGKTGVESREDEYLRGDAGQAEIRVDSMGRPQGAARAPARGAAGEGGAADDRHRGSSAPPSRRSATGSRPRSRTSRTTPTAARSSRSTRATARCSRWRRAPRTSPRSTSGRVDPKKIEPLVNDKAAQGGELPGHQPRHERHLSARVDLEARHRARRDAGAHPPALPGAPVHADRDVRPRQAGVPQLGPVRQPADDAGRGARPLVRHVLLPARLPVLPRGRSTAGTRMQQWARKFGFGVPTGFDLGGEQTGLVPTPAWRKKALHERLGSRLEPRGLDPARDRPEGRPGDAAADGALLRDDRERRQARHAVRRLAGRDGGAERPVAGRRAALRAGPARSRSASTPPRCRSCATGLYSATHSTLRHVVRRVRELPDPDRGQDGHGGEGRAGARATRRVTPRTSRGGAATGRRRPRCRGSSSAR